MASKPKKMEAEDVDEGAEDGAEASPAKSKFSRKTIMIAAAGALVVLGGGAAYFMMGGSKEAKPAVAQAKPAVFLDVPEVLVNLSTTSSERTQYLKVKVVLEVKEEKQVEAIKPTMPRVTDIFQTYLRELRAGDLNGSAGLFRLREELTRRVNLAVAPTQVNAVLFKEIVVQ